MTTKGINSGLKRGWAWALISALFVMPVVAATESDSGDSGAAQSPPLVTVAPAQGWWGELARQPWAKRLARMWTGEEPDDAGSAVMGGRLGAFLDLVERGNLFELFRKGGPIMWPLFCAALLSLGTVLERAGFFTLERFRRNASEQRKFMAALRDGDTEQAVAISAGSRFYVVRVLGYALSHSGSALEGAIQYAKERELHRYRRGIPMLDTVITLAPLLGLLGTVTGMMASFSLIGGELGAPGAITGGIAEALIATAFGLGIAITSLIPFNLMNQKLETATQEIEEAASAMMTLLAGRMNSPHGQGGVA
ncbi:MAG: MotA/TolQ/ExbB proton channel family protein [bacterium]